MTKSARTLLITALLFQWILGQVETAEQFPLSTEWRTIDTEEFQLIFPKEYASNAQRIANLYQHVYPLIYRLLDVKHPRKWKIILNNRHFGNGFVAPGFPRRSEWYGGALFSSLGPNVFANDDWITGLAIHEGRHIAQSDRIDNTGLIRLLYFLGGDAFSVPVRFGAVPSWFSEGDAVNIETRFGYLGRGRVPAFDLYLRTLLLEDDFFSYSQAVNGSAVKNLPNHYLFGYFFVTYMQIHYGIDFWDRILKETAWFPFPSWAFEGAILRRTKKTVYRHFREMIRELRDIYRDQVANLPLTPGTRINSKRKRYWRNYTWPVFLEDGSIVAIRWGIGDPPSLVRFVPDRRKNKKYREQLLTRAQISGRISAARGRLTWSVITPHPRWQKVFYSDIVVMDLKTRRLVKRTRRDWYFDPALSPDGETIASVRYKVSGKYELVLLDATSGEMVETFDLGESRAFHPSWSEDGKKLVYLKSDGDRFRGTSLMIWEIASQKEMILIDAHPDNQYTSPRFYGEYVLFRSAYSGIDNIYAVKTKTSEIFQVTCRRFGAYHPAVSPSGDTLIFSDYGGSQGFDLIETPLDPDTWRPLESVQEKATNYVASVMKKDRDAGEQSVRDETLSPPRLYRVDKYSPLRNALSLHSWGFRLNDTLNALARTVSSSKIQEDIYRLDFHLVFRDLLNTLDMEFITSYNYSRGAVDFEYNIALRALYPWIGFRTFFGSIRLEDAEPVPGERNLWENTLYLTVPLSWVDASGRVHGLTLAAATRLLQYYQGKRRDQLIALPSLNLDYSYIFQKWTAGISTLYAPLFPSYSEKNRLEHYVYSRVLLQTPGGYLFDRFQVMASYEMKPSRLGSRLFLTAGSSLSPDYSGQAMSFSFRYQFPIWHPDGGIPAVLYLRRLGGRVIYQHALTLERRPRDFAAIGAGLFLDATALNIPFPFRIGFDIFYLFRGRTINRSSILVTPVFSIFL